MGGLEQAPDAGSGPRRGLAAAAIVLAVLLASSLLTWSCEAAGAPEKDAAIVVASVDVSRLSDTMKALEAFGSREFHLESSRLAAEYIHDSFAAIGLSVEYQYFTVGDVEVSNVVATMDRGDTGGLLLFGAHYDSENNAAHNLSGAENLTAPGADDNASGVAAVLELARVLNSSGFDRTVRFVAFGAEEYGYDDSGGCKGSEHYVAQEVASGAEYDGTVVLDMVGYKTGEENKAVLIVNDRDYWLARSTTRAVDTFGIDLSLTVLRDPTITYSDHSSFWDEGLPSMLVVEELKDDRNYPVNPYYHTSMDTLDNLSLDQIRAVTMALLGGLLIDDDPTAVLVVFGAVLMCAVIISVVALTRVIRKRDGFRHGK